MKAPREVAEQLALGEVLRQRGAVDLDQRLVPAARRLVHRAGDQLLADAGFAGDQDRQVGAGDQLHVRAQVADRRAAPQDLATAGAGRLALELPGHAAAVVGEPLQGLDQRRGLERRAGERSEDGEKPQVQAVERPRVEGVGGQRADHLAGLGEPAAQAGVDVEDAAGVVFEEAVERVRQGAVLGEADRLGGRQDRRQPGMVGDRVAHGQGLVR